MGALIPIAIVAILFIGLPWLILHYISKMQANRGLSAEEERMLEDMWRSAKAQNRRIEAVEKILEIETEMKDKEQ